MRIYFFIILVLCTIKTYAQDYLKTHQKAIVVDTHNDILMKVADIGHVFDQNLLGKTHSDLKRMQEGGLDVQLFSVYCEGDAQNAFAYAIKEMDSLDAVIQRNPDKIVKVNRYKELKKAIKNKKIAAMFGVEGGHMIEEDLEKLQLLFDRGARYLTLTHNISSKWVSSCVDETNASSKKQKGLNDFGKQVIHKMNALGMLIDVSHAGEQTFWDVISLSNKPIIASHSSVHKLTAHRRNLKDDQIKAIAKNGGVIQINFHPAFIDSTFATKETHFLKTHQSELQTLSKSGLGDHYAVDALYRNHPEEANAIRPDFQYVMNHIEYIIKLVGVDYVGLGSDFDGINLTPLGLDDVTSYPLITKYFKEKGYSNKEVYKIMGGNFLRVLKANEKK